MAHVRWFAIGHDTVLGNVADPKELFVVYDCEDIELHDIIKKLNIEYCPVPPTWAMLGGTPESLVTPTVL